MTELERCRPWIEAALAYSGATHTFADIVAGVTSGHMQLWSGPKGCAVTQIVVYPQKKTLHIFLAGGEMEQLLDMAESAEAWGRSQGCAAMTLSGRLGWQRALRGHGWETQLVQMEKEL